MNKNLWQLSYFISAQRDLTKLFTTYMTKLYLSNSEITRKTEIFTILCTNSMPRLPLYQVLASLLVSGEVLKSTWYPIVTVNLKSQEICCHRFLQLKSQDRDRWLISGIGKCSTKDRRRPGSINRVGNADREIFCAWIVGVMMVRVFQLKSSNILWTSVSNIKCCLIPSFSFIN